MYMDGIGVPQDDTEAVKWFRRAADQGNADAQYGLGIMYSNGRGVPQNDVEAVKWFRLASDKGNVLAQGRLTPPARLAAVEQLAKADQGDVTAQSQLGFMYANGKGVPQDYVEAVKWLLLAANQGDARAQFNLGIMYHSGRGVPQDAAEAVKWYHLSASQGFAPATKTLDLIIIYAPGSRMNSAADDGLKRAREWKPTRRWN